MDWKKTASFLNLLFMMAAWKLERDAVESSSEAECFSSATFFKEFAFAAATLNPNKCL
jgi:hypothetical protein